MALLFLSTLLPLIYISYIALITFLKYREVRKLNVPILLTPLTWQSPIWVLLNSTLIPILRRLPFSLGAWTHYSTFGWTLHDRFRTHARLGPIFAIVSPYRTEFMVADREACNILISKYRIWLKSPDIYKIFDIFGANVNSVNGDDWQRHRKITGAAFTERNNALVWSESRKLAQGMLEQWTSTPNLTIQGVSDDTTILALHVLSSAVQGFSYQFGKGIQTPGPGHSMSYGTAIGIIMHNIMATVLFSSLKSFPRWLLPPFLKQLSTAVAEFQAYMAEGVQEEKDAVATGKVDSKHNLLERMVRANMEVERIGDMEKSAIEKRRGLTDRELYGNLFMFNVGGHETTANTFSYIIPLLAVYPEIQQWVIEEIDEVLGPLEKNSDIDAVAYEAAFPRLKRCLALIYEQLRVYGALQTLHKFTGPASQPLTITSPSTGASTTYLIPHNTFVSVNFTGLHSDPAHWGLDVDSFHPQRWINTGSAHNASTTTASTSAKLAWETLSTPPSATGNGAAPFVAWAAGPRVCPGKKFSQVEFVGVISYLLLRYRVRIARVGGESEEAARERVLGVVNDSVFKLTPKMVRAGSVGLLWEKR